MLYNVMATIQFYAHSLIQLLIEPELFFKKLPSCSSLGRSIGFVLICCGFHVLATLLTGGYSSPGWLTACLIFTGSAGTILLSAVLGYTAMVLISGRRVTFGVIFSLYAFSTGITLFVAWLSFMLWITELWKWWLIYTGFKNTCCMSGRHALLVLVLSVGVQFLLLYSANMALMR